MSIFIYKANRKRLYVKLQVSTMCFSFQGYFNLCIVTFKAVVPEFPSDLPSILFCVLKKGDLVIFSFFPLVTLLPASLSPSILYITCLTRKKKKRNKSPHWPSPKIYDLLCKLSPKPLSGGRGFIIIQMSS